jgi:hypothetical protein
VPAFLIFINQSTVFARIVGKIFRKAAFSYDFLLHNLASHATIFSALHTRADFPTLPHSRNTEKLTHEGGF